MFVFFDTETTGITTAFDQILQFAAILADDALLERDRFEVRCRLLPHVVPSPGALRVTGLRPAILTDPALPSHAEAVGRIHERLRSWSPVTFLGWNSLRFDETLLRQSFFQTLHPPFLTTSGRNGRGDVMRMVQAAHLYAPGRIEVPHDHRGLPSFRLDRVAPANGCGAGNAHDAMADTEATLAVAQLIRIRAPEIWRRMTDLTDPGGVRRILAGEPAVTHTEFVFNRPASRLVTPCGVNPDYGGELAVFDLAFRPEDYLERPESDLIDAMNRRPRVIAPLRATRNPILMPASVAPESVGALRFAPAELERRAALIAGDDAFRARVGAALAHRRPPREPSPHLELRLYERRLGAADLDRMAAFHAAPWPQRPVLAETFEDPRLRLAARRLIAIERPDLLGAEAPAAFERWVADRVLEDDPDAPWRTIPAALREVENALADAAEPNRAFFLEIRDFLEDLADRWAAA